MIRVVLEPDSQAIQFCQRTLRSTLSEMREPGGFRFGVPEVDCRRFRLLVEAVAPER
jgi:hypothetical protein